MRQLQSSTATLAGLQEAVRAVQATKGIKKVILITDGYPNGGQEPYNYVQTLRAGGIIEVVALGVGNNVAMENLQKMSTSGTAFQLVDYHQLMAEALNATKPEPEPPVKIAILCESDIEPGMNELEHLELTLKLTNKNSDEWVKGGVRLEFEAGDFFEGKQIAFKEDIGPDQDVKRVMRLLVRGGASQLKFPESLLYKISVGNGEWQGVSSFSTGYLRGDFMTGRKYNVLPMGPKGHGKSSTVNTLISSLSKKSVKQTFGVADVDDHVTDRLSHVDVADMLAAGHNGVAEPNLDQLPFKFWDIWGLDSEDQRGGQVAGVFDSLNGVFEPLIRGVIPEGTHRTQLGSVNTYAKQPTVESHMHCLVMVCRLATYMDAAAMDMVKNLCLKYIQMPMVGPVVVVTGCDTVEDPKARADHVQKMRAALPVKKHVFFLQNYTDQAERNSKIDLEARKVLLAIRDVSEENIRKLEKLYPHSQPMYEQKPAHIGVQSTPVHAHSVRPPPSGGSAPPPQTMPALLASLGLAHYNVGYQLEDLRGSSRAEVLECLADYIPQAPDRERVADAIIGVGGAPASTSGPTWDQIFPASLAQTLVDSGYLPSDFRGNTLEQAVETLRDAIPQQARATMVARKTLEALK